MAELSPAAQAVMDAYHAAPIDDELTAAAVLRAAADQVVPLALTVHSEDLTYCRHQLLAIAAELEGADG